MYILNILSLSKDTYTDFSVNEIKHVLQIEVCMCIFLCQGFCRKLFSRLYYTQDCEMRCTYVSFSLVFEGQRLFLQNSSIYRSFVSITMLLQIGNMKALRMTHL